MPLGARAPARRTTALLLAVALLAAVAGALWWRSSSDTGSSSRAVAPAGAERTTATPSPEPSAPASRPGCGRVAHAFAPRVIAVAGVARAVPVVTPPREPDGVPGAPPLTREGKALFAWDRAQGTRPGDAAGNVLLNAHTWPDGSALGNRLLRGLHRGSRVVVLGTDLRLCYRVTDRVEVPADRPMPRYYVTDGPPQLAIVVCSGKRLGPGVWTKRTVWFASPSD